MTFAEKLNDLVRRNGDSNESLAGKLTEMGCEASRELVRRMRAGDDPRLSVLRCVAELYGVPVTYLADDAETDPGAPAMRPNEDERAILRLARLLGPDRALLRLADPPTFETRRDMEGR